MENSHGCQHHFMLCESCKTHFPSTAALQLASVMTTCAVCDVQAECVDAWDALELTEDTVDEVRNWAQNRQLVRVMLQDPADYFRRLGEMKSGD